MFSYTTVMTILLHDYWAYTGDIAGVQETHFRKNLAIMGGLLMVSYSGPGRWAIGNKAALGSVLKPRCWRLRHTYMIFTIFVLLLFASPLFVQDDAAAARAAAGCGSYRVNFDVKSDKNSHPAPQPEPGKGLVYVFADVPTGNYGDGVLGITTRVGLDGDWVGANSSHSYFFFAVSPGDHRVCTNWQSSVGWRSKVAKAVTLTAEAGKVYYFRTRMLPKSERQNEVIMKLEPLDPAEGQLLIATSSLSTSQPKK